MSYLNLKRFHHWHVAWCSSERVYNNGGTHTKPFPLLHSIRTRQIAPRISLHLNYPTGTPNTLEVDLPCLIMIRRFSITIFFTASMFSLVVDVLGCPGWASSFTSSRTFCEELISLLNTFLTYSTLTICHFHISSIFEHLIPFFTQNLMHILWFIFFDSRKSPTYANTSNKKCYIAENVNIHSGQVCQHREKKSKIECT